jgi:hypothetical protein
MFFHREKQPEITFADRLERLKRAGFRVRELQPGKVLVLRDGCAAVVENQPAGKPRIVKAGYVVGGELGELVDLGYQKVWQTPGGAREPALAFQLKALHAALEDLREHLGLVSFYNESLGTVNDAHLYDRLAGRENRLPPSAGAH